MDYFSEHGLDYELYNSWLQLGDVFLSDGSTFLENFSASDEVHRKSPAILNASGLEPKNSSSFVEFPGVEIPYLKSGGGQPVSQSVPFVSKEEKGFHKTVQSAVDEIQELMGINKYLNKVETLNVLLEKLRRTTV